MPRISRNAACGSSCAPNRPQSGRIVFITAALAIATPPITSPVPAAYLVRLWTNTSMSYSPCWWKPAKVLSSTVSAPWARARPGDRGDVGDLGDRVGRALEEHQPGRHRGERAFDAGEVVDRQHRMTHAEAREETADDLPRRVVGLGEAQHVIARRGQREQRLRDRIDARSAAERVVAALQFREQQLELAHRRVGGPRIEEAGPLARQRTQGLVDRVELELHALVDRRRQRPVAGRHVHAARGG